MKIKIGEYQVALDNNGIVIPKEFEISNQKVRLIFVRDGEVTYLQLWTDLAEEGILALEDMGQEVKAYIVDCREDGFVQLPEEFLALRGEDQEVLVIGVMEYLEIYFPWQMSGLDDKLSFDVLEELLGEL